MVPEYRKLVEQTKALVESITHRDSKAAQIKKTLSAIEEEKATWPDVNLDDPAALQKISDSRLRSELLPKQLENIESEKGELINKLKNVLNSLEHAITALRDEELGRVTDKIAAELTTKYFNED
jgi:hypothetical protein